MHWSTSSAYEYKLALWLCSIAWRQSGMEVSRPASRPNFNGLGLGLGCPCLGLGLGGPGFVYRVSRTGLGLEAGLET